METQQGRRIRRYSRRGESSRGKAAERKVRELQQERKKFWRHSRRGASPRGTAGKEEVPSSRDIERRKF
jgi:hypothetical protein